MEKPFISQWACRGGVRGEGKKAAKFGWKAPLQVVQKQPLVLGGNPGTQAVTPGGGGGRRLAAGLEGSREAGRGHS